MAKSGMLTGLIMLGMLPGVTVSFGDTQGAGFRLVATDVSRGQIHAGILGETLVVSRDNSHVAYVAASGSKHLVIVDGVEGKKFDNIGEGPILSPDGKRVAYVAEEGGRWLVVVNGVAGKGYRGIGRKSLVFSADSRRVAYVGDEVGRQLAIVDGEGKAADDAIG